MRFCDALDSVFVSWSSLPYEKRVDTRTGYNMVFFLEVSKKRRPWLGRSLMRDLVMATLKILSDEQLRQVGVNAIIVHYSGD